MTGDPWTNLINPENWPGCDVYPIDTDDGGDTFEAELGIRDVYFVVPEDRSYIYGSKHVRGIKVDTLYAATLDDPRVEAWRLWLLEDPTDG